jgi:predicted phosphoribosyltransferase
MFYPSRQNLGDQLSLKLQEYRNNDTIIFCLKKSSLLSCIELAARLHAYIYILQYAEVSDPYDITRPLGVVTENGEFITNPDISYNELEYINSNFSSVVEERKRDAFTRINSEQDLNPNFDLAAFNNRKVLVFADIIKSIVEVQVALDILKPYSPTTIHGAFGNITGQVSDKLEIEAGGCTFMDVLNTTTFDDDHYFDQPDKYTDEQKIKMANNISVYWA